jgi:RNA polymerase sigma-70 factor (ECF subfamily)
MPSVPGHYSKGPEELIVSLAARGDRNAFAELVRRRQPWVRGLFRRFCGNPDLADDLAQKVFLKVWSGIRKVREPDRFAGWLKRIVVNEWIDHQRKVAKEWNVEFDDDKHASGTDTTATAMDLDAALATLPGPVRLCVVLSYHERLTNAEIAELAGLPLGTVKSHIRRGSQRLTGILSAYGAEA